MVKRKLAEFGGFTFMNYCTKDEHIFDNQATCLCGMLPNITRESAKRDPIKVRYDILFPPFLDALAKIAHFGAEKYGDFNWTKSRLRGEKSPINHIYKHLSSYICDEHYDHLELGTERKWHLASIAFNAMMEFYYETEAQLPSIQEKSTTSKIKM